MAEISASYHEGTGHRYQGVVLSDSSRSHLGDVVNINNYSGPSGPSEDDKRWEKFQKALSFDSMDARRRNVDPAYGDTCRWVLETEEYVRWRDEALRDKHHGFLWIKGNPGVGKSTIMKFLLEHAQRHMPKHIILSFFFNARGGSLENSTEGLYRSLLLQLLDNVPSLRHELKVPDIPREEQHWPVNVVQDYFRQALFASGEIPVTIFIDALDEGHQKQVRDMVGYLGKLATRTDSHNASLNICFASRHYPSITTRFREELVLDGQQSHEGDIRKYVSENLAADLQVRRLDLEWEVVSRSQGVFLWIVLVVGMLNKDFDQGYTANQLLKTLNTIPEDLDGLFSGILRAGASDQYLLPALQCVIARVDSQAFGIAQLYFAILVGAGKLTSPVWNHREVDLAMMKRFILQSTKGLVEIAVYGDFHRIQFVHESVRQHLLGSGLMRLNTCLGDNAEASCHAKLAEWCQAYIRLVEPEHLAQLAVPMVTTDVMSGYRSTHIYVQDRKEREHRLDTELPLLYYANWYMMWHIRYAYVAGAYELESLFAFPLSTWITVDQYIRYGDGVFQPQPPAGLLCVFVEHECFALAVDILKQYKMRLCHGTPGFVGVHRIDDHVIDTLVGPSLNATQGRGGRTILMAATAADHEAMVQLLLECGADANHVTENGDSALSLAVRAHHLDIVRMLLGFGAEIQIEGSNLDCPLVIAVQSESIAMAQLLIQHGADVNVVDGYYGTALAAAAWHGDLDIVELLLVHGADVNLLGGYHGTALAVASHHGSFDIVEMLLRHRADLNLTAGYYGTALAAAAGAAFFATFDIVELLLRYGADINKSDDENHNFALKAARNERMRQFLLERGASDEPHHTAPLHEG